VRPPLFILFFAIACGMAVAVVCALCATQPRRVATYMRDKYLRSPKWLRNWPFASMVVKDWYPIYLRVVGIGGFVCAVIWLGLVIEQFSK
jgi:hypothetical protein